MQAIQKHQESQTENVVEEEPVDTEEPEEQEGQEKDWQGKEWEDKWQDKEAWSWMHVFDIFVLTAGELEHVLFKSFQYSTCEKLHGVRSGLALRIVHVPPSPSVLGCPRP